MPSLMGCAVAGAAGCSLLQPTTIATTASMSAALRNVFTNFLLVGCVVVLRIGVLRHKLGSFVIALVLEASQLGCSALAGQRRELSRRDQAQEESDAQSAA